MRDGAGYMTTSSNVAWSILTVFVLLTLLELASLPANLRRRVRRAALVAIFFHSIGLLGGLYATLWWYDDLLHVALPLAASILAVRVVQAMDIFPPRESTPIRAALLAVIIALAVASVWEIFEYTVGIIQASRLQADVNDTMLDMIDGLGGGALAAAWLLRYPRPAHAHPSRANSAKAPIA